MPSQALLKKIAALKLQKFRQKYGQFIVEGRKGVDELIHSRYKVNSILATQAYVDKHQPDMQTELVSDREMKACSSFTTPPGILALAEMLPADSMSIPPNAKLVLCLDGISDPGNLGTLIRTADWFGVDAIILSSDCTDFYNPKCISATMGSFARCNFQYTDLQSYLQDKNTVGCFLDGQDIRNFQSQEPVFLVVGSESHGIRAALERQIRQRITIPGFGRAESLNVSVAAGIAMYHLSAK